MRPKRIVILGSTGTIGQNTLEVISRFPKHFRIIGLSAYQKVALLQQQMKRFKPHFVAVREEHFPALQATARTTRTSLLDLKNGLSKLASHPQVDIVVIAIQGAAALSPFLAAAKAGKHIAPANKEALVMAGSILMAEAKRHGAKIVPVDSEQSAIFQCLRGEDGKAVRRIYLTASGGALYRVPKKQFRKLTKKQVLSHPRWRMGKKITVDSATMMNKGLEIIEARWLFDIPFERIQVVVHPEAIIHSMVEFTDGAVLAQLGVTDMKLPIQYALTYPDRWNGGFSNLDFFRLKKLTFLRPNEKKFPALRLCREIGEKGGTYPAVLNAANEEAVAAFLEGRIGFVQIYKVVVKIIEQYREKKRFNINEVIGADCWARQKTRELIKRLQR